MARTTIDRETVQRIIDTANIVEVVSDFVHLHAILFGFPVKRSLQMLQLRQRR